MIYSYLTLLYSVFRSSLEICAICLCVLVPKKIFGTLQKEFHYLSTSFSSERIKNSNQKQNKNKQRQKIHGETFFGIFWLRKYGKVRWVNKETRRLSGVAQWLEGIQVLSLTTSWNCFMEVPCSNPWPCFVNSQLVSLLPVRTLKEFCSV